MPFELLEDEISTQEQPSFLSEVGRQTGRTTLRAAETAAGLPGDILSLINDYISGPLTSKITGKETIPYEELGIAKALPTSQQLRKGHEKQFGEKIKPENKIEELGDELIETVTSIFSPGAAIKRGAGLLKGLGSATLKGIGAITAKEVVKNLTADEKKGSYAKLGALTLLSFIDKKGAAKAIGEGYEPLSQRVTQLNPVNANFLENNLNSLKSKMLKGTQAPSEKFIIDEVDAVLQKIKNGKISPEELWASKRSLNEKMTNLLFSTPEKAAQQRARKLSQVISHDLDDTLALTKSQDPKFFKDLKAWNHAYKTVADSNFIARWAEKNINLAGVSPHVAMLYGIPIAKTVGAAAIPYTTGKIVYRIMKDPKLAKHYMGSLAAATAEDASTFNKELRILDKEIKKKEKSDRFILVD